MMTTSRRRLVAILSMGAVAAVGWFAYAPALSGAFLLDDLSNLGGLRLVDDKLSALIFVFSGDAGPLGRPLALATFALQAPAWGESPAPFLRVNILIHLLNGCLLAFVLQRLAVAIGLRNGRAICVALAAAALWLLMPLLASASLMVVQRMTTLSATFVLLGLGGYLQARASLEQRPFKSLLGMSASLVVGTLLAAFAKENGALLPTFALAMEATILKRPERIRLSHWRGWQGVFLVLPTILILGYIATRLPYSDELVLRRDFSGWERLLTESRILWEYLVNAFVPRPGASGPFHDGHPVSRTIFDPVTFAAFASWLALFAFAIVRRRRYPLFAFAVLWFLGGHVLESTVVPLELYFEHRNYLPVIGPVFALCAWGGQMLRRSQAYAAVSIYGGAHALVLLGVTSLWGSPAAAASYWQEHFPGSVRAATTVATYRLASAGPRAAAQTLHRLVEEKPQAGYVKVQELNLKCMVAPRTDHGQTVAALSRLLGQVDFSYTAVTMLSQLFTTVSQGECEGVDNETVRMLARRLQANPRYVGDAGYSQLHEELMARIARQEGKHEQTVQHLKRAMAYGKSTELNMMIVTTYADAGEFDFARRYIDEARHDRPDRPMRCFVWTHKLNTLSRYVDELQRLAKESHD